MFDALQHGGNVKCAKYRGKIDIPIYGMSERYEQCAIWKKVCMRWTATSGTSLDYVNLCLDNTTDKGNKVYCSGRDLVHKSIVKTVRGCRIFSSILMTQRLRPKITINHFYATASSYGAKVVD